MGPNYTFPIDLAPERHSRLGRNVSGAEVANFHSFSEAIYRPCIHSLKKTPISNGAKAACICLLNKDLLWYP